VIPLGTTAGPQSATATVGTFSVTFGATAGPGPAALISVSGGGQTAYVGATLASPLTVTLTDAYGNARAGDAEAGVMPLAVVAAVEGEGDRRAEEALHLVAEAADGAPATASRQETKLGHEATEGVAQVQGRALGADGLGGDPRHQEPRVAAVGQSQEGVGRDGEHQVAVSSEEGVGGRAGVRQGRLDENTSHEAQGARLLSLFGLDGESLGGELARAGAVSYTRLRARET